MKLSEAQQAQISHAARPLPPHARQVYRQRVAELLQEKDDPGDGDVHRATVTAQREIMLGTLGMAPEF